MAYQALEAILPRTRDPVDHVAAVGSSQGAHALAVRPRVGFKRGIEPELQILERLAAPVAADGIGERLTVAGGAVKIDHDHAVARAREGFGVPAPAPRIAETALRAAVNKERNGIFALRFEIDRLDHIAENILTVPAGKAELLVLAELALLEQHLVQMR